MAQTAEDYWFLLAPSLSDDKYGLLPQTNFTEGVFLDYFAFDAEGIEPRFAFGFGLSYTTFEYSGLRV